MNRKTIMEMKISLEKQGKKLSPNSTIFRYYKETLLGLNDMQY